ncbi:General odorant-binding protein 28a [Pseudolycoriella hygida]|uniref:General odorant-binding protein 28a n=1 Tax=Pseudolycoriella hygida TaxID=35572 RepID=A0A9Q0N587_9DIPT|nr:General odorant-binding protein 28a [Pseudolycoriella hygida]
MKTLAILIISCCFVAVSKAAMTEAQMKVLQMIIAECAEKEKATQADLEELMAHKPATSRTAKCHRACMHETFGTMKDNKFNSEGFLAMINMKYKGDAAKMKIAQDVTKDCENIADSDRCEAGAKICKCLYGSTTSRGLDN